MDKGNREMSKQKPTVIYVWTLLSIFYYDYALRGQELVVEEDLNLPSKAQVSEEVEALTSMTRSGESQEIALMKSNLAEHLFSSGSASFVNHYDINVALSFNPSNKVEDSLEKQKQEWLDALIKQYLKSSDFNVQ